MDENTNNIPQQEGSKGMAIASLVCGILSITIGCCMSYFDLILAIVAAVLGGISISKKNPGKGMAVAGIVMGIIAIVIWVVLIIMAVAFGSTASTESYLNMLNSMK